MQQQQHQQQNRPPPNDWQSQQSDDQPATGYYSNDDYIIWASSQPQPPPQLQPQPQSQQPNNPFPYPNDLSHQLALQERGMVPGFPNSSSEYDSVSPEDVEAEVEGSGSSMFRTLNDPASTSSSGEFNRSASAADIPSQSFSGSFSGPSGIPSSDHIAPSGTSLRRGMACKFCRRRKLRCSGERPLCSSCVKYKQECEYQPPVKVQRVQGSELHTAELSDYIQQGGIVNPTPAFSSQPLAYDENELVPLYTDTFNDGNPHTQYQYIDYPLPPLVGDETTFTQTVPTNDSNFHTYVPALPQATFQTTYPNQTDFQYTYPSYPESSQAVELSNNPSPTRHSISLPTQPTQSQFSQGFDPSVLSSSSHPGNGFDNSLQDDNIIPNYSFPNDPTAQSQSQHTQPLGLVPSRNPLPSNTMTPSLAHQPSDSSSSQATQIINTPSGSVSTPGSIHAPPGSQSMYAEVASLRYTAEIGEIDPVEKLTERLGEFLFSPKETSEQDPTVQKEDLPSTSAKKRRTVKTQSGQWTNENKPRPDELARTSVFRSRIESDGLRDEHRNLLLDCFLAHCRLFFEMSIPRFRYRMTFNDRRKPSLALLNGMYLWATRMSASPNLSAMEAHFFSEACRHLDSAGPNSDRLIDAVRAAMLLCAYAYTNGRHHEGWLIAGLAVRLVTSTGLHQISSLTFRKPPKDNPFLRNRIHLLPPPEDAIELAERVHAFWCVYAIEKCGALATGFPSSLRDEEISTPFGRPLDEIASQAVTSQDDLTIRDLYRGNAHPRPDGDSPYIRWIKAVTILERASKLTFLHPTDDSEYNQAWSSYGKALLASPSSSPLPPPAWLNQPKYKNPKDYDECAEALKQYVSSLGIDGINPVERRRMAEQEGSELPQIKSHSILLHHQVFAIEMLMHDINSTDVGNDIAVAAGRRSAELIKALPSIPPQEVDAHVILVWCMIAKTLIKELRRTTIVGDFSASRVVEEDIDVLIAEMRRISSTMHIARVQSLAMEELKKAALAS
ncbi:uncharacterized protein IL334_001569 [Kwoniella shivajii]|uniref:Zn(2)-C6 fungal-type domain-containing protein n=1 Tax=Kwoniella shivajii TaxID=564305 RepID=A0ABZ1CSM8_9TREE|nr:hypothetical protein IL334_001569 [Kwoniella shivajii]